MKTKIITTFLMLFLASIGFAQITGTITLNAGNNANLGCSGSGTYNLGSPQASTSNIPWTITSTYWQIVSVTQGSASINTSTNVLTWTGVTSPGIQYATITRKVVFNNCLVFSDDIVLGLDKSCGYDKPTGNDFNENELNTTVLKEIVVYPMPSQNGKINIGLDKEYQTLKLIITSFDGNKIYEANYEKINSNIELDLSGLKGNYILQLTSDGSILKRSQISL